MSGKHLKHTLSWHDPGTGEQGLEVLEECHSLSLAAGGSLRSLFTFFQSVIMVMWRNCILPPSQNDALSNQVRLPILHQVLPHLLQRPQRPQPGLSFHLGHGENWLLETFSFVDGSFWPGCILIAKGKFKITYLISKFSRGETANLYTTNGGGKPFVTMLSLMQSFCYINTKRTKKCSDLTIILSFIITNTNKQIWLIPR